MSNSLFGFHSNHNTELAILLALDFILKSFDANIPVISLYIDISNAFNFLDRNILRNKLFLIGFRDIFHPWLKSYLTNRFQYVENFCY